MNVVNYFMACESVLIDEKGRQTLVNIFDTIETDIPSTKFKVAFTFGLNASELLKFSKEAKEITLQIQVVNPEDEPVAQFTQKLPKKFVKEHNNKQISSTLDLSELEGLKIESHGEYKAHLVINGKLKATKLIRIAPKEEK